MLFLLVPVTFVLAVQDWRSQKVNLWLAILCLGLLTLKIENLSLTFIVLSLLMIYRYCRSDRIQLIDVAIFSFGAGYFSVQFFSIYCLVVAGILWILSKVKENQLPFLVAWAIGFWLTLVGQKFIAI